MCEEFLFNEFKIQTNAMLKGFSEVIPLTALSLFTWNELEVLVCGSPDIDVEVLKEHTSYSGYSATDDTIVNFWTVFEELSREERTQFIRFAWGRSRLPTESKWPNNFQIQNSGSENSLPCSHTCFFKIDLPPYKKIEELRKNLLICINFGVSGVLNS